MPSICVLPSTLVTSRWWVTRPLLSFCSDRWRHSGLASICAISEAPSTCLSSSLYSSSLSYPDGVMVAFVPEFVRSVICLYHDMVVTGYHRPRAQSSNLPRKIFPPTPQGSSPTYFTSIKFVVSYQQLENPKDPSPQLLRPSCMLQVYRPFSSPGYSLVRPWALERSMGVTACQR